MIFHKFAVLWTISISSSFHDSTAFVISPSTITSSILRRNKIDSSHTPFSTITITHASPKVSFISLEQGSNNEPSNLSSEQLNALTDAALGSNSTAASILLREINDAGENGSVEDKLLHLVDKGDGSNDNSNINDDDELQPGKGLPLWTKIRISAKFSKRARRASLRRVLNLADSTADAVNGGDNTRRRNALVLVLRVIAQANISADDDVGTGIWDIERDARKERKNNIQDIISSGLDQTVLKVDKLEEESAVVVVEEKEEERPISTPIEETPTLTEAESRQKFNEESKILARTIEKKVDAIETERARVQKIADRNKQLEAEKSAIEEKEAAAIAAEQVRLQAIADRNQQIEDEKRAEKEKEERLKIAKEESAMKPNAGEIERARVQAILDRNEQIEAEKRASVEKEEKEAAAIAAEHASAQLIVNERNQRALLTYHLELDAKTSALEAEKKAEREAAFAAAEQAKVQSIANERNQRGMLAVRLELDAKNRRLEAEKMAEREREEAAIAAEKVEREREEEAIAAEKVEREREAAAISAEQKRVQSITNERNQRAILTSRIQVDAKRVMKAEAVLVAALEQEAKEKAAALEQEAEAKAIRIEEAVKASKALNAELERKQRYLFETRLQLEAAEKEKAANAAEAKRVMKAEAILVAALEQEAKEKAAALEQEAEAKAIETRLQLETAERENAANAAEVEETSTVMPKVENEATKEDKIQVRRAAIANARKQPKNKDEEKTLADYYGAMDLEERAFTILYDLGMIEMSPDPDSPDYNHDLDDEFA